MRWWWVEKGGGIFQLYSICCVIWGLAGICVCLAGLGSFPLFMVSVHPSLSASTCPSASRPGIARCFTAQTPWKWNELENRISPNKIIDVIHFCSSWSWEKLCVNGLLVHHISMLCSHQIVGLTMEMSTNRDNSFFYSTQSSLLKPTNYYNTHNATKTFNSLVEDCGVLCQ